MNPDEIQAAFMGMLALVKNPEFQAALSNPEHPNREYVERYTAYFSAVFIEAKKLTVEGVEIFKLKTLSISTHELMAMAMKHLTGGK